jgi:hypothetical protein
MPRRLRRTGLACLTFLALAGCGDRSKSGPPVRGQVLYRGDPVAGGLIVFVPNPDRGSDGPTATAVIEPDGSFTLVAADGKPVAPGWYRVAVAPKAGSVDVPTAERPYPGLPAKYRNPVLSGLEREVKAGAENTFAFDLDDS